MLDAHTFSLPDGKHKDHDEEDCFPSDQDLRDADQLLGAGRENLKRKDV